MASIAYPYGVPTVNGEEITVSMMLNQPTRVTRYLSDIQLQQFFSPVLFTPQGGVSGGAVIYDQLTLNELYTDRDVQDIAPGAEFPDLTSEAGAPLVARVVKTGGKITVTDEARDRNNLGLIQREGRKVANTIARDTDRKAVALLDASIAAFPAQSTIGNDWSAVVTAGTSASSATAYPGADFAGAQLIAEQAELGYVYDTWVVNPQEKANFNIVYGSDAAAVLASYGITMLASNRVAAGTAYACQAGMLGEIRTEKALGTETIPDRTHQRTILQTDVRAAMYVTDPYAVVKITGLAG